MHDENTIVRERQRLIRRQMERDGILLKQVQLDGGWKTPSTVQSYFPADPDHEPATMSVAALYRLIVTKALPVELLSLLLPPGHMIVQVPEEMDHDQLCEAMQDWLHAKHQAHHPESEAGREIGPGEDNVLRCKFTAVAGRAA